MLGDRPREAVGAEERPDPARLALERRRRRRVVEEHDPQVAVVDRARARGRAPRRPRSSRRTPGAGAARRSRAATWSGKPPTKPFSADDADLAPAHLDTRRARARARARRRRASTAIELVRAGSGASRGCRAPRRPGIVEPAARVGEHRRLAPGRRTSSGRPRAGRGRPSDERARTPPRTCVARRLATRGCRPQRRRGSACRPCHCSVSSDRLPGTERRRWPPRAEPLERHGPDA